MVRGVSFSVAVAAWMLTGQHAYAGNISDGSQLYRAAIHVAVNGLEELVAHATSSIGRFMVDGGGDGGGDGGSDGSDGGDTGDSDSTSGDTSAPDGPSDPADSVSSQANAAASDPTDSSDPTITNPAVPNDPSMTPEMAAIEAIPTTAPRGGFDSLNPNPAYPTIGDASAPGTDTKGGTLAGIPVAAPRVNAIAFPDKSPLLFSAPSCPSPVRPLRLAV